MKDFVCCEEASLVTLVFSCFYARFGESGYGTDGKAGGILDCWNRAEQSDQNVHNIAIYSKLPFT